jgi:hypothetical protein
MWPFIGLTVALFLGLAFTTAWFKRDEVKGNWSKYKDDLLFMFAAPLFKPDDDPRSPVQFATDNFSDVMSDKITQLFAIFLQPVFQIFKLFTDALNQTLGGLFNIRALMSNMWNKWNEVFGLFMRRFNGVFHHLRQTFVKLTTSFERLYGIAISSVYSALSLINTITSFMDLMIIVAIAILVILIAILIFLFLFMWPLIPVILLAIGVIAAAGFGGAMGGMSEAFCFAKDTRIAMNGSTIPIQEVKIGDVLRTGASVLGIMAFDADNYDLWNLYGVQVSGTHIVYDSEHVPQHVRDHPEATPLPKQKLSVYCLITSDQRIPIVSDKGIVIFADWEELSTDDDLHAWHRHVWSTLNPDTNYTPPTTANLASEAVLSGSTHIWTPLGRAEIRGIHPGATVLDAQGKPTRVLGVVKVDPSVVKQAYQIGPDAFISQGCWIRLEGESMWSQLQAASEPPSSNDGWYSLFTESGAYRLCENMMKQYDVRDFSDVGRDKIHETYNWVLESLVAAEAE